jgi:signal transduction histidine kinase
MNKFLTYILRREATDLKELRTGLISGLIIYSIFGILDVYMMPDTYHYAWLVRFGFVAPAIIIFYVLTFRISFKSYTQEKLFILLLGGQIGLLLMLVFSTPNEEAFYAYYAGLILVYMWSGFVFNFSFKNTSLVFVTVILSYNLVAIFVQDLLDYGTESKQFAWFLGNNFFLISSGILSMMGTYRMQVIRKKLAIENSRYRLAKEKAEESDQLKSAFLSNMSHEIRTPLNSIIGFSNLLINDGIDEDEKELAIQTINQSGENLMRIISDILDISQIETNQLRIEMETCNITDIMKDTRVKFLQLPGFKRKPEIELTLSLPNDNDLILYTDPYRFQQILDNLITNANKFTQRGTIEFGYTIDKIEKAVTFYVKDSGIGIAKEKINLIFERFRQVESGAYREGSGLGLSICYGLVRLLGGNIFAESEKGKGSTFSFTLPLIEQPPKRVRGLLKTE